MTDEYYDEFMEVMTRKGLFPPYGSDRPRLLFRHLYPNDMLLAVQVLSPEGQSIATGLFPHDDKTIYYWGGASRLTGRQYSPNDLMHWSVMEWALKHGLTAYNMCGPGKFKQKFGGASGAHPALAKVLFAHGAMGTRRLCQLSMARESRCADAWGRATQAERRSRLMRILYISVAVSASGEQWREDAPLVHAARHQNAGHEITLA